MTISDENRKDLEKIRPEDLLSDLAVAAKWEGDHIKDSRESTSPDGIKNPGNQQPNAEENMKFDIKDMKVVAIEMTGGIMKGPISELDACKEAAEWADDMRKVYKEQLNEALEQRAELLEALKAIVRVCEDAYSQPRP